MNRSALVKRQFFVLVLFLSSGYAPIALLSPQGFAAAEWMDLFDGQSMNGWRASENESTWKVQDGCLVAQGERSHLFYEGLIGDHDFRNFDLQIEVRVAPQANSGVYFHTAYQSTGWPSQGYEIQINNSYLGTGDYRELKCTGSLYGVRNIYKSYLPDNEWTLVRVCVVQNRVRVWVNGVPTVDYLQPESPHRGRRATVSCRAR